MASADLLGLFYGAVEWLGVAVLVYVLMEHFG